MSTFEQSIVRLIRIASPGVVLILGLCVSPGLVAALSAHGDAELAVSAMLSVAGPLHGVRNRLPGCGAAPGPIGPAASTLRSRQQCHMTIHDTVSYAAARQIAATTLVFAVI